jgi:uncharacterized protein YraI
LIHIQPEDTMFKRFRIFIPALMALLLLALAPGMVSAQVSFGTNWSAEFWNNTNFEGIPAAITVYPGGLNFNWGTGRPRDANNVELAAVNPDNFSARFQTTENFLQAGDYTFSGFVDDQVRVFIDGIEVFSQATPGNFTFNRTLTAGVHALRVDYVELTNTAILQFQWQFGGVAPIFTPTPAPPSGPQAHVVNVRGLSLRTGPYLGASFIGVLRPDNLYLVHGKNNDEGGGFTWYRVTVGERVGWASGRYLRLNVEPATIPDMGSVFDELHSPHDTGVTAVPRAVMNFRRRPSIRSARIGQIPWGAEVPLLNRTIQGGQNFWFQVRYQGQIGWIFAPFVSVRGNIDAVPIR